MYGAILSPFFLPVFPYLSKMSLFSLFSGYLKFVFFLGRLLLFFSPWFLFMETQGVGGILIFLNLL